MRIRRYEPDDHDAVVDLSLRAWAPVFDSIEGSMQPEVYAAFYRDGWRESQRRAVSAVLDGDHVWVATGNDGVPAGFVAMHLHGEDAMGEIYMVAVDPDHQGKGLGVALNEYAIEQMRAAGMQVAMVETGSDPGHAPARRVYERVGFRLWPVSRYFMKL